MSDYSKCEKCNDIMYEKDIFVVEAFETFNKILCDDCFQELSEEEDLK